MLSVCAQVWEGQTEEKKREATSENEMQTKGEKKKIIPTTVPFIPEMEQCASNQKA